VVAAAPGGPDRRPPDRRRGGALAAVSAGVWYALRGFAAGGFLPLLAAVLAAVGAGAAVYIGLAKALKLEELTTVWRILRRRRVAPAPSAAE
jgi:hypothetical protein